MFLLDTSLQVDLSFWPAGTLAPIGTEPLTVLFGETAAAAATDPADLRTVLGWGWLYALHTRAAIARGRVWQAVQMLDGLRDQVVVLSCHRHGLPTQHGRGTDQLPATVLAALARTLPTELTTSVLGNAYTTALGLLVDEVDHLGDGLRSRLDNAFTALRPPSNSLP